MPDLNSAQDTLMCGAAVARNGSQKLLPPLGVEELAELAHVAHALQQLGLELRRGSDLLTPRERIGNHVEDVGNQQERRRNDDDL